MTAFCRLNSFVWIFLSTLSLSTRDYSITFHTGDRASCESGDNVIFYFQNASAAATSSISFSPAGQNTNTTVTFTDIDLGTITQLYMRRNNDQTDGWCFDKFFFTLHNNTNTSDPNNEELPIQRGCSVEYQGLQFVDYDCSGDRGSRRQFLLDVSSTSPICWDIYANDSKSGTNYASALPANGFIESVANASTNRTYSITFTTTGNIDGGITDCGSTGTMNVRFKGNCSWISPSDGEQFFDCNSDTEISTKTVGFIPGGENETFSVHFIDYKISNITHLELTTSSTDEWCVSSFTVLLEESENGYNNKWAECDLTFFRYGVIMDSGCSGDTPYYGGYKEYTLRIDEHAPYCTIFYSNVSYNTPAPTAPSLTPTNNPTNPKYFGVNNGAALTWSAAETACNTNFGTSLASIHNNYSLALALASVAGNEAWIGLTDTATEDTFVWVDGSPFDFTDWDTGQPDGGSSENCVHTNAVDRWNDLGCDVLVISYYICNGYVPTYSPTTIPTAMPSGQPTILPTDLPSSYPSTQPSYHPSGAPSEQPTILPSVDPSGVPSSLPTTQPSVIPTIYPTSDVVAIVIEDGTQLEFINENDIKFVGIEYEGGGSINAVDGRFNGGYRIEFVSNVEIILDNEEKVGLFEYWVNNEGDNSLFSMDIGLKWKVHDSENDVHLNITEEKYQFDQMSLWVNDNGTRGIYFISSSMVLFPNNELKVFSTSVCDNQNGYFGYGTSYTFTNEIEIDLTYDGDESIVTRSKSVELESNSPAVNGTCTVFPGNSGNVLIDLFNFTCNGWVDADINGYDNNITYNFLYDNNIFFNSQYDNLNTQGAGWISTLLPNGDYTISAVMLDSMSLPTCVDMNMSVQINLTEFDNYPTANFTQWLVDIFEDLVDNNTTIISTADSVKDDTSGGRRLLAGGTNLFMPSLALSEQIVIRLLQSYIDEKNISTSNTNVITTYESILGIYLDTVSTVLDELSTAEIGIHLNSLASLTNTAVINGANVTYSSTVVNSIIDSLTESVELLLSNLQSDASTANDSNSTQFEALDTGTAEVILDVLSDLITIRGLSDESLNDATSNGQAIVDLVEDVANAILVDKLPGEFFLYSTDELIFKAAKISIELSDECGLGNVQLSNQFLARKSNNGSNFMNCGIMQVYTDLYATPTQLSNYNNEFNNQTTIKNRWQAPFFMLNVENEDDYINENDDNDNEAYLSTCEPILISFNSTNTTFWDNHYATCSYYNETSQEYRTDGCYVLYSTNDFTTCSCLHTTLFSVSWENFEPQINFISSDVYHELTFENLWKYPLGWIAVLCWVLVCLSLVMMFYYCEECEPNLIEDTPLVAQEKVLLDLSMTYQREKKASQDINTNVSKINTQDQLLASFNQYMVIQELNIVKNQKRSILSKVYSLWKIKLRTDHMWLGICFRSAGTSYTTFQRISVMMVRLLTTMAVSALFYGQVKQTPIGDLSLSLYESAVGFFPLFVIQKIIKEHKPHEYSIDDYKKRLAQRRSLKLKQQQSSILRPLTELARLGSRSTVNRESDHGMPANEILTQDLNLASGTATSEHSVNDDAEIDPKQSKTSNDYASVDKQLSIGTKNDDTWKNLMGLKQIVIKKEFILPNWCRFVANGFVVLWTILCAVITSLWCVYFDVILDARNTNSVESECIDYDYAINVDISEKDWMNYNATQEFIANLTPQYYSPYEPPQDDSWGDDIVTSDRFLYSVLTSYVIGVVFWQPVVYFILSFVKYIQLNKLLKQIESLSNTSKNGGKNEKLIERKKVNQVLLFAADLDLIESDQKHNI